MKKQKQQESPFTITLHECRAILADLLNRMQYSRISLRLSPEVLMSEEGPMIRTCVTFCADKNNNYVDVASMFEDEFQRECVICIDYMPLAMNVALLVTQHALRRPKESILDESLRSLLSNNPTLIETIEGINAYAQENKL